MDNQNQPASGDIKQQITQRLKDANNVLVTVSNNPSVDQLAAAIGLTLVLNKLHKHATAVFSGKIPAAIEFLEPEKTIEKNTDSLQDFIIALDKSKADKLRYKVEDKLVKIFITPYKTSITDKDLEFSQGDFNVDVVIALGVKQKEQLDQAITTHGRILHDATVMSLNIDNHVDLGSMNWVDTKASSLSEMVVSLIDQMDQASVLDGQMATSLLTGIVAATDRFRNAKTTPTTMSISSRLMAAGANQQLIANKLDAEVAEPKKTDSKSDDQKGTKHDGSLNINHPGELPPPVLDDADVMHEPVNQIHIDEHGTLAPTEDKSETTEHSNNKPPAKPEEPAQSPKEPKVLAEPPTLGGTLTANSQPEGLDPTTDPLSTPSLNNRPLLDHNKYDASPLSSTVPSPPPSLPKMDPTPPVSLSPSLAAHNPGLPSVTDSPSAFPTSPSPFQASSLTPPTPNVTPSPSPAPIAPAPQLSRPISPPLAIVPQDANNSVDMARDAVSQAISGAVDPLEPIQALNANPIDLAPPLPSPAPVPQPPVPDLSLTPLPSPVPAQPAESSVPDLKPYNPTNDSPPTAAVPDNLMPKSTPTDNTAAPEEPGAPPPVPPPLMPPSL